MTRPSLSDSREIDLSDMPLIGGKRLVRPLGRHRFAERFLAFDIRRGVDCLLYLFNAPTDPGEAQLWQHLRAVVGVRRPHTLHLEEIGRDGPGRCWAAAAYPGNHETLVTLASLRQTKAGVLSLPETARAVRQLLEAVAAAHAQGVYHGPITEAQVLVNPRGTLLIELYGLERAIERPTQIDETRREELRSIAAIAWTLLTGLPAEEREVFAAPARGTTDRRWMDWIDRGLDPASGFADAEEAIAALPDNAPPAPEILPGRARSILGRFVWASSRKETREG
jgi:hypothetical protein